MGIDLVNKNQRFSGRKNLKINEKIELFEEYLNNGNTGKTIIYDTIYEGYPIGMYLKTIRYELNDEEKAKKYSEETINKLASLGLLDDKHESTITKKIDRLIEFVQNNPELWQCTYFRGTNTNINEYFGKNLDSNKRKELIDLLKTLKKDYEYILGRKSKGKLREKDIERLREAGVGGVFGNSNKQQEMIDEYGIENNVFKNITKRYGSLERFYMTYIESLMKGNNEKTIDKNLLGKNKLIRYFDLNAPDFIYRDNEGYLKFLENLLGKKIIIIENKNVIFECVDEIIESLKEENVEIMKRSYGLDGFKKVSYQKIGELNGITREGVRQRIERSIKAIEPLNVNVLMIQKYILNYGVNEEEVQKFLNVYFKKYSAFYTEQVRPIDKGVKEELTALLSKKMKNITVQELDEAGFEVGIGDIDKFDEVSQGFDSVVEKTKEETKKGGTNRDE